MSGHNRWSKIKHKKEATDSKKSKIVDQGDQGAHGLGAARRR